MHCSISSTLQQQQLPRRCCGRTADCRGGSRVTMLTPAAAAAASQPATATAVQAASLAVPPPQQQLQQQQMPQLSHQLPVKHWHMQQPTHQQSLKQSQEHIQPAGQRQSSPLLPQQTQQHWQQDPHVGQVAAAGSPVPPWADSMGKAGADSSSSGASSTASSSRSRSSSKAKYGLSQTLALLRRSSSNSSSTSADAARAAPHLLTSAITQCETLSEVLQVMCEMSSSFNNVHVAAMMARLPKILRCQQQQQQQQHTSAPITSGLTLSEQQDLTQLLQDLSQLSEEVLPSCSPREMVNIAWGFAALGFYNRRLLQLLLGRCTLSALKPQELSALTWAVAKLGHEVSGLWVDELLLLSARVLEAGGFKPQEAANLAWGLAVLQRQCMASSVSVSRHSCTRVDAAWKAGFCRAVEPQLGFWGAADVSQTLWALAVLGFSGIQQQWLDKVLIRGLELLSQGHLQSRHASVILWSVMQLQQQQQWAAASAAAAADTTSGSSSSSTSSSGPLVSPTVAVFAAAVASKLPLLLRGERRPLRFAAMLLFSCQKLKMQPPVAAMDYLIAAAGRQLESLELTSAAAHPPSALLGSSSGSGSSVWRSSGQQQQQGQRQPCSTLLLDVSMLLYSFTQLSYRPGQKLLDLVAAAVADRAWRVVDCHDALAATKEAWELLQEERQQQQQEENEGQLGGQQASSSCDAVTAYKQQQILQQRQELLKELHSSMHGREASLLLWSMAKLQYQPSAALLRPLKMAALRQRQQYNATDVGVMLWALARMRHKSGYVWLRFMLEHFLAHIDDRVCGVADVCNVVHALPHLPGGNNQCYVLRQKVGEQVLQGLADAAASRFSECGPRELVQLAQGFALLGFTPAAPWLQQHQQRAQELGKPAFSKQEKQILRMAYRRLSATPRPRCDSKHPQQQQQQQLAIASGSLG